jgi:hypothetical protein
MEFPSDEQLNSDHRSTSKPSQGQRANYTGNSLEQFVYTTLLRKGYQFLEHRQFEAGRLLDQPIFTVHYPIARSIYDTQLYCDFVLFHPTRHPDNLIIESKWQQSRGSVDEKFPFLVANIRERYPHATIIILDGGGYKKQADLWLRAQIDGKLFHVFNMQEFQKWSNGESL